MPICCLAQPGERFHHLGVHHGAVKSKHDCSWLARIMLGRHMDPVSAPVLIYRDNAFVIPGTERFRLAETESRVQKQRVWHLPDPFREYYAVTLALYSAFL